MENHMSNGVKGNKIDYQSWLIFRNNILELKKEKSWAELGKQFKGKQGWAEAAINHRSIVTPGDVALSNRLVRELKLNRIEKMKEKNKMIGQLTVEESEKLKKILRELTGVGQNKGKFRVKELSEKLGCTDTHISTVKSTGRASKKFYDQVFIFWKSMEIQDDAGRKPTEYERSNEAKQISSGKNIFENNKKWNELAIEGLANVIGIIEKEKDNQPKSLNKYYGGLIEQLQMVVGELD